MYSCQYYIRKAIEISKKSNDPVTKVGCVLVLGNEKKIIASGFNYIFAKDNSVDINREIRKALSLHAEKMAILSINNEKNIKIL